MSDPAISIVLPTHNGAKYLAGAIESTLKQTRPDWELIIVESDSTDETPQIAARYAAQDSRIRVIQHPKAAGRLPGALNAGFAMARGRYHTWLSDDNEFFPESLERLGGYLDAHPEVGLVYSHFLVSNEDGTPPRVQKRPLPTMLPSKNVITPSFLYRADLHHTIGGYRTPYFLAEDYDFYLRAYDHVVFHRLDEVLHFYRFHEGNLTAALGHNQGDLAVVRLLDDNLQHVKWLQQPYPRARALLYAYELATRHSLPDARKYWWQALRTAPLVVLRRLLLDMLPSGLQQRVAGVYRWVLRRGV